MLFGGLVVQEGKVGCFNLFENRMADIVNPMADLANQMADFIIRKPVVVNQMADVVN